MTNTRLQLGNVVITPNALASIPYKEVVGALLRHRAGDFGDVSEEDREANQYDLENGGRILSAYNSENGIRFWIITEHDRSATTILLPEDY